MAYVVLKTEKKNTPRSENSKIQNVDRRHVRSVNVYETYLDSLNICFPQPTPEADSWKSRQYNNIKSSVIEYYNIYFFLFLYTLK